MAQISACNDEFVQKGTLVGKGYVCVRGKGYVCGCNEVGVVREAALI